MSGVHGTCDSHEDAKRAIGVLAELVVVVLGVMMCDVELDGAWVGDSAHRLIEVIQVDR